MYQQSNPLIENQDTVYRVENSQTVQYSQNMIIENQLNVKCQFITEQPIYSNAIQNQNKTHAVLELSFNSIQSDNKPNDNLQNDKLENTIINKYLLLVDRSQSMISENKLMNVKQSLQRLLENTKPNTQYALISFGNSQKLHFKFTDLNENKETLKNEINNINATGQTNIVKAIQSGHSLIQEDVKMEESSQNTCRHNKRQVRYTVVLLTDGFDNQRQLALNQIREFYKNVRMNYSINTLGFGDEHDPHLLAGIASHSGGKFYYIKTNQDITPFFEDFISLQEKVIVEDIDVEVECNEKKELSDEYGNKFLFRVKQYQDDAITDTNLDRIYFKQIRDEDEKNILLRSKFTFKHSKQYKYILSEQNNLSQITLTNNRTQDSPTLKDKNVLSQSNQNENSQILQNPENSIENNNKIVEQQNSQQQCQSIDESSISSLGNLSLCSSSQHSTITEQSNLNMTDISRISNSQRSENQNNDTDVSFILDQSTIKMPDDKTFMNDQKKEEKEEENLKQQNLNINMLNDFQGSNNENRKLVEIENKNSKIFVTELTIGTINVIFRYHGKLYKFSLPMVIKFTSEILQNPQLDDRVQIQLLRSIYVTSQQKSNNHLEQGQGEEALKILKEAQLKLQSKNMPNFPIYNSLVSDIEDSILKVQKYIKSKNTKEKDFYKKEITITQQVNICHFKEVTTSK